IGLSPFATWPMSTMQTRRRSAFGCFSAEMTEAMRNGLSRLGLSSAFSDLNRLVTFRDLADVDHADAQAIGVRVLLGGDDRGDDERLEQAGFVLDVLDLETDHGELVHDRGEPLVGVEMLLEPGQGEFHELNPPASVGKSSGGKP